jgi:transcriptional accessory protein Tex/SPT6
MEVDLKRRRIGLSMRLSGERRSSERSDAPHPRRRDSKRRSEGTNPQQPETAMAAAFGKLRK